MQENDEDEYYFLIEKLEEVDWAIKGECDDIDCNKYVYKSLLKKGYRSVLEHNFSCVKKLKHEKYQLYRRLRQI